MRASSARPSDTATRILDVAERLVQTHGFNGFSYADVSAELEITKASLHYHFASKAELGRSLVERYHRRFAEALAEIDRAGSDPGRKLRRYVQLYADVLEHDRMCLCGMLAADHATLPKPMREQVKEFFDLNEGWLTGVLEEGRRAKALAFHGPALQTARLLVGALEGGMLVARSFGDASRFRAAADRLLTALGVG